jgi:ribonucleoside-diphosphate reductase alpha chain
MTSNRDIPFAKSLIDYIFCWMGCQFIPGYTEHNTPNRTGTTAENKNVTTARQVVEKTRDLAQKIAEVRAEVKTPEVVKNSEKTGSAGDKPFDPDKIGAQGRQAPSGVGEEVALVRIPIVPLTLVDTRDRFASLAGDRADTMVTAGVAEKAEELQSDAALMQQFNAQFQHFQDDAPVCDVCGAITVRNGTCYKCFNCGNSMGCS